MYKVIIIEDDPMVASINKQYVELTSSFHVEATFKNGILALQYLQNCTVDLIILDYYTPQMNGDEFIDQLHAAGMTPAIIMVTSANDAETVRRLISRGVTDYLVKPFEYDRFKAALERFAKRQEELKTSASASDLGQAEIDRLFSVPDVSSQSAPLTKGLNERTLGLIRLFLSDEGFLEIETPCLVGSTPEGARDFVVPSRMSPNQFYALPQSPQTLKQLLMVAGYDKYFQIVRCFRDEDLRADRQPEFTQIDCEMSFVEQEDVLEIFERWAKHMFREVMGIELTEPLRRMPWIEAMEKYGSDKPDLRFGMEFADLTDLAQGHGFAVFDDAEYVTGFAATGCAGYTRKQIDALTEFVKRQQIGAKGLVWIRVEADGNVKSSVDKFYSPEQVRAMAERAGAKAGDLVLILCGKKFKTLTQLCALRLEVAQQLGLRDPKKFAPLWVIDFPLFEWDDETQRYYAVHHPFTSPKLEDVQYLDSDPGRVRANAYDFVCNGTEIGGGSIRIHDSKLQAKMFELLGFTAEQAQERFGFLMNAFKYGAPPHGGLAFGFDRLCSLFGGSESIRDYIAFPKNNNGRDMMLDAPGYIDQAQLDELYLQLVKPEE